MKTTPAFPAVAGQELLRAFYNTWTRLLFIMIFAYTIVYLGVLYQSREDGVHTMQNYVNFLSTLRWGALGVAAVMAGPSLLEDVRRGALELYLARAVTKLDYYMGKILALLGATTLSMLVPGLLYYAVSFFFFDAQPEKWNYLAPLGGFLYALLWGVLLAGLGMGISSIARSSRGATLVLLGAFAFLDILLSRLLEGITRDPRLQILSPFAALQQQTSWIFQIDAPFQFPAWWGMAEWAGLTVLGWALVVWKHPRVRGEERVRA